MPPLDTDYSCGIIPIRHLGGRREYLLVQHDAGHWSFPKGHPERRETPLETARRELAEETGLVELDVMARPAFEERYVFRKRSGRVVDKQVTYFLGWVRGRGEVTPQPGEILAALWADVAATRARLTFDEGRRLLDEVEQYLCEQGV